MGIVEKTVDEAGRIATLGKYDLFNKEIEEEFQGVVKLAAFICDVPSSMVSIVGENRQWFKGKVGNTTSDASLEHSFCARTIRQDDLFVVEDSRNDVRFQNNPLVSSYPNIVFYAGFPLKVEGHNVGTLCIHDTRPKVLSEKQIDNLRLLTYQTTKLVELRGKEIELTRQNEVINNRNVALNESTKVNKQLISMISHDVRGPISSILSLFKFKKDFFGDLTTFQKVGPLMESSLRSIYNMLDNMLSWSNHINSPIIKKVNILDITLEVEQLFASQLEMKGNKLQIEISKAIHINCDKDAISFIIRNLVGNAIKYTSQGKVTVEVLVNNEHVTISVKDTGIGISEKLLEAILLKEKVVSTNGTQNEAGSGMGINFIQQFLDRMDSKLMAASVENEGTTFSFSLPLAS
jgi:signal transduction histidine kinase